MADEKKDLTLIEKYEKRRLEMRNIYDRSSDTTSCEMILEQIEEFYEEFEEALKSLKHYVSDYPCSFKDMDCRDDIDETIDEIFGEFEE